MKDGPVMKERIRSIRKQLMQHADLHTKESSKRFFKERVRCYGVKTAQVRKIAKGHFNEIRNKTRTEIYALCETLWQSGYMEESFIACSWSYSLRQQYEPEDFNVFEKWINTYVDNWASCDTLCNHTLGALVERYPECLPDLKKWALSDNRWVRRASAVSLILPARQGKFLKEVFEIADALLLDEDDLVQKGYGWMLKAASQAHPEEVFEYVMRNKENMPRTALRYAIEKMDRPLKEKAMKK